MNLLDPEERNALAGDYVRGTLSGAEQTVFALALARDPALRAEVVAWQDRLLGLAPPTVAVAVAVAPSPGLWSRIAQTAAWPHAQPPLWQRLGFWQGLTAVAALGCLVLAVSRATHPGGDDAAVPHFVAVLQSPDKATNGWLWKRTAAARCGCCRSRAATRCHRAARCSSGPKASATAAPPRSAWSPRAPARCCPPAASPAWASASCLKSRWSRQAARR